MKRLSRVFELVVKYWWAFFLVILFGTRGVIALVRGEFVTETRPDPTVTAISALAQVEPTPTPVVLSSDTRVYFSASGKLYHLDPTCSGLDDPKSCALAAARVHGLTPCTRCVPEEDGTDE